jgi:PAS domain S-box-containing protein
MSVTSTQIDGKREREARGRRLQGGGIAADFLTGSGMGMLIRAHEWSATPLGPIESWPQSLKTATAILLRSPVPMVMLWGEDGIMIYNDAYSGFAGARHPLLLGSKVREGWPEVAEFNDHVMRVCLAGNTLSYKDQELTLYRTEAPEQVWMNLDYSPVIDESGKPAGVLAIVVETTEKVLAERRIVAEQERLRQSEARFRALVSASSDVVYRMSADWSEMSYLVGRDFIADTTDPSSTWLDKYIHEDDQQRVLEVIHEAIRTNSTFELEHRVRRVDGSFGWTFSRAIPLLGDNGEVTEWFGMASDVTARKTAEDALRASEERFRKVFQHSNDAIFVLDPEGDAVLEANPAAVEMFGYDSHEELLATPLSAFHPDDLSSFLAFVRSVHDEGVGWTDEFACRAKSGRRVPSEISASTLTIDRRRCLLALVRDVEERKRQEQHRELLLGELNHRVKNTLATVQAIASQTFRGDAAHPEARAAFDARLVALSLAHTLLTRENWDGVALRDIGLQALVPFTGETAESSRFTVTGEHVRLQPSAALAFAMTFHELATNAVKYGSLSNDVGRVDLSWELRADADSLHVRWQESGGPPVEGPSRKGFGSRLIEQGLARELSGTVHLDYRREGLVCDILVPARVRQDA